MIRQLAIALVLATAACGDDDARGSSGTITPPPPTAPADDAGAPILRTMGTARAMGTRPENLVLDPVFGSLGGEYAQGIVLSDATAILEAPATSPAGASQPVLVMSPSGDSPSVLLQVQGGSGPLDVRVYVASDPPATVSLLDGQATKSFDVPLSSDGAEIHGDRTYKLYHATISDELLGKAWLMVTSNGASDIRIAAPEMTSPEAPAITFAKVTPARAQPLDRRALRALAAARAIPLFHGVPRNHVPLAQRVREKGLDVTPK